MYRVSKRHFHGLLQCDSSENFETYAGRADGNVESSHHRFEWTQIIFSLSSLFQKIKVQLNPFGPVFRPIVARFVSNLEQTETIENQEFVIFCRLFIETFLKVSLRLYSMQHSADNINRSLRAINVHHESKAVRIS